MKIKTNWSAVGGVLVLCCCLNFIVHVASPSLAIYASVSGLAQFVGSTFGLFGIGWLFARLVQFMRPVKTTEVYYRRWAVTAAVFAGMMYVGSMSP